MSYLWWLNKEWDLIFAVRWLCLNGVMAQGAEPIWDSCLQLLFAEGSGNLSADKQQNIALSLQRSDIHSTIPLAMHPCIHAIIFFY